MAEIKHFVVVGLGTFGAALARRLKKNGCRVTGIDVSESRVEELKEFLYEAVIGDATERDALAHLSVDAASGVIISLGENITLSLLATLHAKELGARNIVVKGVTSDHGKLLKSLGVARVIFPETEIALQLADKLTWPNVIDLLPIDPEYSFIEIAVPDVFVGKTLLEINLRRRFGVWVVGIKDVMTGHLEMFPDAEFRFQVDQMLLVVGKTEDLVRVRGIR